MVGTEDMTDQSVDFSGLILGFSSAALSYMGYSSKAGITVEKNLELAKQNIDIIDLLKQKTDGNLSPEEKELVEQVLLDLKGRYTEAAK